MEFLVTLRRRKPEQTSVQYVRLVYSALSCLTSVMELMRLAGRENDSGFPGIARAVEVWQLAIAQCGIGRFADEIFKRRDVLAHAIVFQIDDHLRKNLGAGSDKSAGHFNRTCAAKRERRTSSAERAPFVPMMGMPLETVRRHLLTQ